MIILFFPLSAVLVAGWIATWFVHRPRRWLWFFAAGFGLLLLVVAGFSLRPQHACQGSGMACLDDYSFFATGNLLFGAPVWLALLVVTGLAEGGRAIVSAARSSPE